MEPVSMIVGALAMGAAAAAQDVGADIVAKGYTALKELIVTRYRNSGGIAALEENPNSIPQKNALEEALSQTSAPSDADVLAAAKNLVKELSAVPGDKIAAVGVNINNLSAINVSFQHIESGDSGTAVLIENLTATRDVTFGTIGRSSRD